MPQGVDQSFASDGIYLIQNDRVQFTHIAFDYRFKAGLMSLSRFCNLTKCSWQVVDQYIGFAEVPNAVSSFRHNLISKIEGFFYSLTRRLIARYLFCDCLKFQD